MATKSIARSKAYDDDSMGFCLSGMTAPVLSDAEIIELSHMVRSAVHTPRRWEEFDPLLPGAHPKALWARNKMVIHNQRLIVDVLKRTPRFRKSKVSNDDLIQVGAEGLQRAAEKYDPKKGSGFKFSTYAYIWIKQSMSRIIDEQELMIRLPSHQLEWRSKIGNFYKAFKIENQTSPTDEQVAEHFEITVDKLYAIKENYKLVYSLDKKIYPDSDVTMGDAIESEIHNDLSATERVYVRSITEKLLAQLTDHERKIVTMIFGLDGTEPLPEVKIAKKIGVSRQAVQSTKQKAFEKIRTLAKNLNIDPTELFSD